MEIQQAYKQKMAAQLKEWSAQIELLGVRVENAGADVAVRHARTLQDLRAKQSVATEKLQELERSTDAAWAQVKTTADKIWEELSAGVAEAHNKFK